MTTKRKQPTWRKDPIFSQLALDSCSETTTWILNEMSRQLGPGDNLDRSKAIQSLIFEFTEILYLAMNQATAENDDYLKIATLAVSTFIIHMLQDHQMPREHAGSAINLLTYFAARIYHNMEPKT